MSIIPSKSIINKYTINLQTGKNREIRRIFEAIGCRVIQLKRIEYDSISLESLKVGKNRYLTDNEIESLSISIVD